MKHIGTVLSCSLLVFDSLWTIDTISHTDTLGCIPADADSFELAINTQVSSIVQDIFHRLEWKSVVIFSSKHMGSLLDHLLVDLSKGGIKVVHMSVVSNHTASFFNNGSEQQQTIYAEEASFKLQRDATDLCPITLGTFLFQEASARELGLPKRIFVMPYGSTNCHPDTVDSISVFYHQVDTQGWKLSHKTICDSDALVTVKNFWQVESNCGRLDLLCMCHVETSVGDNPRQPSRMKWLDVPIRESKEAYRNRLEQLSLDEGCEKLNDVLEMNKGSNINLTLTVGFKEDFQFSTESHFQSVGTWSPFTTLSTINGEEIMTGFMMDLLSEISRELNIRFQYIDYPDEGWGNNANGSWDGLLGLLYRKQLDFIAPLYATMKERNDHFDMTYPVIFNAPTIGVYRKPSNEISMLETVVHMFGWEVLLLTFASLLITAFTIALILHTTFKITRGQNHYRIRLICASALRQLWHLSGNLLKQGHTGFDLRINRFVHGAWWLVCLIISSLVTATLVASLSAAKPRIPFTSLQQLVNQDTYTWGVDNGNAVYIFARQSEENSPWFKFWKGMQKFIKSDPDVVSTSANLQLGKVKGGNHVYVVYQPVINRDIANDCNLTFFEIMYRYTTSSMVFWKGSPYTDMFSKSIVKLHETGFIKKLNEKWVTGKRRCPEKRTLGNQLHLGQLDIIFKLLIVGGGAAFFVLILEILWTSFTKNIHAKKCSDGS